MPSTLQSGAERLNGLPILSRWVPRPLATCSIQRSCRPPSPGLATAEPG